MRKRNEQLVRDQLSTSQLIITLHYEFDLKEFGLGTIKIFHHKSNFGIQSLKF